MFENPERFEDYGALTPEKIDSTIKKLAERVKKNIDFFKGGFPCEISNNNIYDVMPHNSWVEGFYPGILWLLYELTGDSAFCSAGENCLSYFKERIEKKEYVNHHDMGFLYTLSCVAQYKLTGSETAKDAAILAAENLASRFQEKGQFIQAWGDLGDEKEYRLIVDCLLNLPLLRWAYDETKEDNFIKIANAHFKTTSMCAIRDAGSAYHTYFFDKETGAPTFGKTHQGFSDDSAWSRGQAWCVYGFALGTDYSDSDVSKIWHKVTDYYLDNLPQDKIAYWDLFFKDGDEPRDASSNVIAICGIFEAYRKGICGVEYLKAAKSMLNAVIDTCQPENEEETNGLLSRSTYSRNSYKNEECTIWGDYFLMEALMRIKNPEWDMYW